MTSFKCLQYIRFQSLKNVSEKSIGRGKINDAFVYSTKSINEPFGIK